MNRRSTRLAAGALAAALLPAAFPAAAQSPGWQPFVSVTPVYQGDADLDRGGDFSLNAVSVNAGVSGQLGGGTRAGVSLSYDYYDYSFSNPVAFGGVAPWNIVQNYGVAVPLSFAVGEDWNVGVVPSVNWFRENGADSGESLIWGGIVSATRRFQGGNRLGVGVGVFGALEETKVFPVLLVDWRLGERWRLINPLPAGPAGPAGLELDYEIDERWTVGIGAAWRELRFRLSESGPTPNGIGQQRGVPVFLRATHRFDKQMAVHLWAGVVAGGELRVEDASGNLLREDDFDPAPVLGLTFSGRF